MSVVNKLVKPTVEILDHLANKVPSALSKGHGRLAQHVHNAADHFDRTEDGLAGHVPSHHGGGSEHEPHTGGAGGTRPSGGSGNHPHDGDDGHHRPPAGVRPGDGDRDSRPPENRHCEGDPVDVASGELIMPLVDVRLPGALELVVRRTHISSYRNGGWFGTSWASTLDQRLHLDAEGVVLLGADGTRLVYPPPRPGRPVVPVTGPRLPLGWSGSPGAPMTVVDSRSGLAHVFDHPRPSRDAPGAVVLRLASIQDRNGRTIDVEWSEDDTPRLLSHHGGYRVAIDMYPDLRRIAGFRLLDADGQGGDAVLARYGYDAAGDLTEVVNSSGSPLRFTYDDDHRVTSWSDRTGTRYSYEYDDAGRVVRTTGTEGYLSGSFAYDDESRTTRYTNSLGHTTVHQFNTAYRTIRSTDALGRVSVQQWSEDNRLLKAFTDPLGRTTRYEHDALENVSAVVQPDGSRTSFTYNSDGMPVELSDPAGRVWRSEYDEWGNRTATVDPLGTRTTYVYDDAGDLTEVTDAAGGRVRMTSNAAGLPLSVTDERGGVTSARRDAFGRIVEATDPMGNTIRVGWSPEGQVEWVDRADGRRESWSFDADGRVVSHTSAAGAVHTLDGTHFDLVAGSTTSDGSSYAFSYDTEKRLTEVTNPLGQVWSYSYDPVGQLVQESDFDGRIVRYTYDAAGQLASRTNGAGETVSFERDALGRIVAYGAEGETRTTYTYDDAGNLRHTRNADAEVVREHDLLGRVTAETVNGRTITYAYDALGRRTERRTPSGVVSTWSYDASDLPESLVLAGHRTTFSFDPSGRESARRVGDDLTLSHDWDSTGRMTRRGVTHGGGDEAVAVLERHYAYQDDDLLTEIRDLATGTHRFALDRAGRVTSVSAEGWSESYVYDALGNVAHATTPLSGPDDAPREASGTRLRRAGRTSYAHDAQGRVVSTTKRLLNGQRLVRTFTWNSYDELVATVTPEGEHWHYLYDAAGRRIGKQRLTAAGSVAEEVHFTWDVVSVAEQTVPGGTTTTWEYAPGGRLPLAQVDHIAGASGTEARFHAIVTDLVGAPTELVTPGGDIAWQPRATLWGTPTRAPETAVDCPLRFPGQYADPETAWHYNHFRHYDPETARYTAPDPLGLSPSPNPTGYVPNPTAWADPLGLKYKKGLAGWDDWEPTDPTWTTGGKPQVTYGPLDDYGRATKVTAHITPSMLGQNTDPHIAFDDVPGWEYGANFNRTHLLAASLGGSNTKPENFTAMHRYANHPVMYHYEKQAKAGVNKHGAIDYEVTAHYHQVMPEHPRPEDLRPIGMTIRATSADGTFHFTPYQGKDAAARQTLHYDENGRLTAVTILNVPECVT